MIGLTEERCRIVPFEGCGFISEEEASLAEALFDSGESTVRVDAFSIAEVDEGVAVPLTPALTLPMVLASLPLDFATDEKLRLDRRRRLSKKDGLPAMAEPGWTRACRRSVRRNSMRFQKRQWLTLRSDQSSLIGKQQRTVPTEAVPWCWCRPEGYLGAR